MTRDEAIRTLDNNSLDVEQNPDGSFTITYSQGETDTYATKAALLEAWRKQKNASLTDDEDTLQWEWETDARQDRDIAEAIFELYA